MLAVYVYVLRRTLVTGARWKATISSAPLPCTRAMSSKTTAPGPVERMDLAIALQWIMGPLPSTFINAQIPQVCKTPPTVVAFTGFLPLPCRFVLLSALTAF